MTSGDTALGDYRGFEMIARESRKGWWQGRAIPAGSTLGRGFRKERPTFYVEEPSPDRVVAVLRQRVDRWHLGSSL